MLARLHFWAVWTSLLFLSGLSPLILFPDMFIISPTKSLWNRKDVDKSARELVNDADT